jgi:hypothetical protein
MKKQTEICLDLRAHKQHGASMSSAKLIPCTLVIIVALVAMKLPSAFAQSVGIASVGNNTVRIGLYKPDGNSTFALVEIKGNIEFGAGGIISGKEAFLRLQTIDAPDKWFNITSSELVNGRAIVTTEDNKVYTIYNLQGNLLGRIAVGRVLAEDTKGSGVSASQTKSRGSILWLCTGLAGLLALVILFRMKSRS